MTTALTIIAYIGAAVALIILVDVIYFWLTGKSKLGRTE